MRFLPGFGTARQGRTAVDVGAGGIFGVSVRSSGTRPQVVKIGSLPESTLDAESLAQLARKIALPNFGWVLPLKRGEYSLLVIAQPAVEREEMKQSLRWSIGSMVDFPVDEAVIDWITIPTLAYLPQRPQHIYAVAARQEVVKGYADLFERTKLEIDAIDIRETAQRNISACIETAGEALGMVAVDPRGVQITFTYEGELYLDRYIEWPLEAAIAGDDETRKRLFDRVALQVQRSMDFVRRTLPFLTIGRIVIAPLPAPIALREHIAEVIAIPVDILDLATIFDLSLVPELREAETQANYFVALGAALRGRESAK